MMQEKKMDVPLIMAAAGCSNNTKNLLTLLGDRFHRFLL
jgi:hypothetical protein